MRSFACEFKSLALAMAFGMAFLLAPSPARQALAGEVAAPKGAVILTVAGKIANWNRGPFDPMTDSYHKHLRSEFDRAFIFDREMLRALPQITISAHPPILHGAVTLEGPGLGSIFESAGIKSPETVRLIALDGYEIMLTAKELQSKDWTLALAAGGKPLGIGQQGLIWLVHTPAKDGVPSDEEFLKWGWAIFYVEVR